MDTRVEFRLLGPVEAAAGGRVLELAGRRQRALLALLLLEPGHPVSADRLAEELWHGEPPPGAETTLRSYVSRLRRALGRDAVVAATAGYVLRATGDEVDSRRFERLLREGREALGRGAAGLAAERLRAALALWRGPALADVCHGGALAAEARRLDELRLDCLEERIEADLELARHAELVPELRALVGEHSLRERLWRQLVLALYRSGRQAEALDAYHEARTLLEAELGLEPGPELRQLELAILRQEVEDVAPAAERHNLPAATTSFVGRERELAELEELLRVHRLVTLTGVGGSGKTRLATEAARRQADAFADGVWLVDLTALAAPELVPGAVAATLGVRESSREQVVAALVTETRGRELLLVLDNCEHVVAACAGLASALLRGCPNLRILATSRIALAVAGEVDYALDPLPATPAVRLFVERAAAARRDLAGDEDALPTIVEICRELDGLPLAIELAAARVKALSLTEIAARLDDRFRFLRAWQRVADPRHQTLGATMDWSYGLLAEEEQALLRGLSAFAGGATLDAVAAVCLEGDEAAAIELLARLVDASLVRAERGEQTRYRLLETVRQYAAAKLAEEPAADAGVRRRHAEHYLAVAESANLGMHSLGRGPQRHEIVLAEQHNIRAALDWATDGDVELAVRLALALENFWVTQDVGEGRARLEQLLARVDGIDAHLLARATFDYAGCVDGGGDGRRARELYTQSGELFRAVGDAYGALNARYRVGVVATVYEHDLARGKSIYEEVLEGFREIGSTLGELQAIGSLGTVAMLEGDHETARTLLAQSIEMARAIGWVWWISRHVAALATVELDEGDPETAERYAREFLRLVQRTGSRKDHAYALALFARVAAARGDEERALLLWSTVEAIEERPDRFGRFDRAAYAARMPDGPRPAPLPVDEALALVAD